MRVEEHASIFQGHIGSSTAWSSFFGGNGDGHLSTSSWPSVFAGTLGVGAAQVYLVSGDFALCSMFCSCVCVCVYVCMWVCVCDMTAALQGFGGP